MHPRVEESVKDLRKRPGASEDEIRHAETALGRPLPQDYLEFIATANGAEGEVGES